MDENIKKLENIMVNLNNIFENITDSLVCKNSINEIVSDLTEIHQNVNLISADEDQAADTTEEISQ